jgi:hypothetical protein
MTSMRGLRRLRPPHRQRWLSLLCLAGLLLGRPLMRCSSSTPDSGAAMPPQQMIPAVAAVLPQQHEPAEETAPSSSVSIPPPTSSLSSSPPEHGKTTRRPRRRRHRRPRRIDAFLAQLHGEADLDRDGRVTFEECYARILLFYIYVNRQAEIAPPTRTELANLYQRAGWTLGSTTTASRTEQPQQHYYKGLDADEFTRLAKTFVSRAASRLLVHKIVTIVLAPYVALSILDALDDNNNNNDNNGSSFWKKVTGGAAVTRFLRTRFLLHDRKSHNRMIPPFIYRQLTSRSFWLSVFMVLCIKTLPDLALALMNYYFDETRSPFVHRYLDFRDDNHDGVDDRDEPVEEEMTTGGSSNYGSAVDFVVDDKNEMKDTGTPPSPPGATSSSASLASYNLEMAAASPVAVVVPSILETKTSVTERYTTAGMGDVNNNALDHSTSPDP